MGATATGKSGLALDLAEEFGREIISADSRQVYRGLRIGTAQPSSAELERAAHHLADFLPLEETWSAQDFAEASLEILRATEGRPPLIVGGTGFWLRSLMEGLFPLDIPREATLAAREALEPLETQVLYHRLEAEDAPSAARLHPNDRQRILRALELLDATGMTMTEHHRKSRKKPEGIEWTKVFLTRERAELHSRIEARLDQMLSGGWPEEVEGLLSSGVDAGSPGMQALGYPEVVAMLRGESSRDETRERILHRTRQYARRQEIWFRKEEGAVVLDAGDGGTLARLARLLSS